MNNPVLTIRLLWLGVYVSVCVTVLAQRAPAQSVERYPVFQVVESFHAPSDQELEMLKKDLRSQKKQIIASGQYTTNIRLKSTKRMTPSSFWSRNIKKTMPP
jgi:hypothetical protein